MSSSHTDLKTARSCSQRRQGDNHHYRIVVMGAAAVGKSAIISQFLYDRFIDEYKETVEELHRGEYDINGRHLTLDILDTSGAHAFPAMRKLAIATSDAFVLVYSVSNDSSFDAVKELRDQVIAERNDEDVPIVIVGNKTDVKEQNRSICKETAETLVNVEWGNGYVEASAKDNWNIVGIFKEILSQSNIQYNLSPAVKRRRQSMPAVLVQKKTITTQKRHSCSLN
ncbi:ras-related protein Rap-2a-like [Gigantopelta aegis]|uniref:ras-related protein Rap-2a-like n=1 Tax=Gigantopelta aegis TaxID=1735272 RepID=UPI001B88DF0D|nr:ras-related protein Rap-2a-like [Gigantopelta aegis]